MKKWEFVNELNARLRDLPKTETDKYIEYYLEMIDDRTEEGMTEEEAVGAVGSIDEIESKIRSEYAGAYVQVQTRPSGFSFKRLQWWQIALMVLGSIFLIPFVASAFGITVGACASLFGVVVACFAVVFALYVVSGAMFVSGAALIVAGIAAFFNQGAPLGMFTLGGGFLLTGLSVLMIIGLNKLTELMIKGIKNLISAIVRLFRRGRRRAA